MTTVTKYEDGGVEIDTSEDPLIVDFEVRVPEYVPSSDEGALRKEVARRMGWRADNVSIRYVEHEMDSSELRGVEPEKNVETFISGTVYVEEE